MTDEEIAEVAAKLHRLDRRKRDLNATQDSLRALLRMELVSRGVDRLRAGKLTVRETSYTRQQFDAQAFRLKSPALYAQYCKPQTVSRIEVVG